MDNRKIKYKRTIKGVISDIYCSQRGNCKRRGLPLPKYSKEQIKEWILSQPNFKELYNDWVQSGYDKKLKPSVDRLDDYKGYSLDNIRLVTWEINHKKGSHDRKNGINNKVSCRVNQLDLKENLINSFHSIIEASRVLKIPYVGIHRCCNGKKKSHKGYIFEYATR